jgi:hypothetical protein
LQTLDNNAQLLDQLEAMSTHNAERMHRAALAALVPLSLCVPTAWARGSMLRSRRPPGCCAAG